MMLSADVRFSALHLWLALFPYPTPSPISDFNDGDDPGSAIIQCSRVFLPSPT